MAKIIAIAVVAAAILLTGTAVVYAQTTDNTPLQQMPVWGHSDGTGGNYYQEMLDYCVSAGGTSEQAQEHYRQMEEHMQDGTWQQHMSDGTCEEHLGEANWQDMQQHMGDGTYQNHMSDGTYQNHMGDGTWQEHHGTDTGTGNTDTAGYGHMGGGMGM